MSTQCLLCTSLSVCTCMVTIGLKPAELMTLWWPQPAQHTLRPLAQESHVMAHGSRYWADLPAFLPAKGRASGQSHFQQINLICKFSSPCNFKPAHPPSLNSLFLFLLFLPSLPLSSPKSNYWMSGGSRGTEGWMSERREGGREGGMEGGRLVIISIGHSVNDYPLR